MVAEDFSISPSFSGELPPEILDKVYLLSLYS